MLIFLILDPITYWLNKKNIFPHLSKLALKYLIIPNSSSDIERTFSQSGNIISEIRNRLSPELTDMMLFLKINLNNGVIDKDYLKSVLTNKFFRITGIKK